MHSSIQSSDADLTASVRQAAAALEVLTNEPTFQDDADAVLRLGRLVTSFRRIGLALRDPRCKRPHLIVLYALMEAINHATGTAFPSRRTVAQQEGLSEKTVENVLYELRSWGHIDWERRAEPDLHKGRLLHYTLPVARWSEEDIAKAILEYRANLESTRPNGGFSMSPPQRGQKVPVPTGTSEKTPRPSGAKSPRPDGVRNLLKEPTEKTLSADAPGVDATSKEEVKPSPKRAPVKPKATGEQFERFWTAYPKREGKAAARKNLLALTRDDAELAIAGAEAYARKCRGEGKDPKYIKWPQGWLSERRFEDFASGSGDAAPAPSLEPFWWRESPNLAASLEAADWQLLYNAHAKNGVWPFDMMGAQPGAPGCLIPRDVIPNLKLGRSPR